MRIFIITETLLTGGAEWFALRLCKALVEETHDVHLFVLRPDLVDKRLTESFKELKLCSARKWQLEIAVFIDRVTNKLFGKKYCCQKLNSSVLQRYIRKENPDVLHSNLITSDLTTIEANRSTKILHVTTIHGDYIQSVKKNSGPSRKVMNGSFTALDHIVVISGEQINILTKEFPVIKSKFSKIYNGYQLPQKMPESEPGSTFNFGLIARGIKEKGWELAIQAFLMLDEAHARLYLYGESIYLSELREKYSDERIIFSGFSNDPLSAVSNIDAGLLPSYYDSESLPTTIIEYLAMSKPVIATSVGEIPFMITNGDPENLAGILIDTKEPKEMVLPLCEAMRKMMNDPIAYKEFADNCLPAYSNFEMDKCVKSYVQIYKNKKLASCAES